MYFCNDYCKHAVTLTSIRPRHVSRIHTSAINFAFHWSFYECVDFLWRLAYIMMQLSKHYDDNRWTCSVVANRHSNLKPYDGRCLPSMSWITESYRYTWLPCPLSAVCTLPQLATNGGVPACTPLSQLSRLKVQGSSTFERGRILEGRLKKRSQDLSVQQAWRFEIKSPLTRV